MRGKRGYLAERVGMSDDDSTLGERMNRDLFLDPGFQEDKPGLVDALREETDETVKRAQAAVDRRRREAGELADETSADEP